MTVASSTSVDGPRKAAYFAAQQAVYKDAPWVFGYVLQNIEAQSTVVDGWGPAADNSESVYPVSVRNGDSLVIAMRTDSIGTFDPAIPPNRDTETVLRNIYDALVAHTLDGKVVPQLATSWHKVGPAVYDFTLRSGVKFQNGDPLTADDVVFTFERVLTPGMITGQASVPRKDLLGRCSACRSSTTRTCGSCTAPRSPRCFCCRRSCTSRSCRRSTSSRSAKTGLWPSRSAAGRSRTRGAP